MTTAAPVKRCTKCQKDLTGAKRLKDAKGQYWCPDCGVGDTSTSGSGVSGLMSTCPKCKTSVHATDLIRDQKSGSYICQNCAAGVKVKGGSKVAGAPASEETAKKKKMLILGVLLIAIGIGAYFFMENTL
jgi:DNA-directed RNA polymerase subunit RPC12/RpoP